MSAPERCIVCRNKLAHQINEDLIAQKSIRWVANKYNLKKSSVQDHKVKCMSRDFQAVIEASRMDAEVAEAHRVTAVTTAKEAETLMIIEGTALIIAIQKVVDQAEALHDMALNEGDKANISAAIQALNTKLKAVDSFSKIAQGAMERERLKEDQMKNDWGRIKKVLMKILDKYPEVKKELMDELSRNGSAIFA